MLFFFMNVIASTDDSYQNSPYSFIIILLMFVLIFYFIILRPQQKRNKDHKKLINSVDKGDEVLTVGGIVGKVIKVTSTGYVIISLNKTNEIIVKQDCITAILPKDTINNL